MLLNSSHYNFSFFDIFQLSYRDLKQHRLTDSTERFYGRKSCDGLSNKEPSSEQSCQSPCVQSFQRPCVQSRSKPCEPLPSYGPYTLLCAMQRHLNKYMDEVFWDGDVGLEGTSDPCCFVQLIVVLFAVYATTFRRMWGLFEPILTAIDIAIQLVYFALGQLLDIAKTRNGRDVGVKTAVFFVQCVTLAVVAYLSTLFYTPVVRYGWYLFTASVNAPIISHLLLFY